MVKSSRTLEKWRDYFLTANSDIFDIIVAAIMVAAVDCPKEFKSRRDQIAELIFSCKVTKCSGCDKVELSVPDDGGDREMRKDMCKNESVRKIEAEAEAVRNTKEGKMNFLGDDEDANHDLEDMGINENLHQRNYSYGDAEALTDEIEEESQLFGEVLRIKTILEKSEDVSESLLFDSLRRLQLMDLSVQILQETKIGIVVNCLRRHGSQQIRQLAKTLVNDWKAMVDECMLATAAIASDPRNSGEFNKNHENGRKPSLEKQNIPKRKQQIHGEPPPRDRKVEKPKKQDITVQKEEPRMKKQAALVKPNKPAAVESGRRRPPKPSVQQKINYDMKSQQKSGRETIQKRELVPQQNRLKSSDDAKLEATKRKLQERYQEADNAKRQKKIQVLELQDLPKQGLRDRNPHFRPSNQGIHWGNGRR